jgi:phosphohistidine phosphatase
MLLYLLRHAEAVAQGESDAARTLTKQGFEQASRVGRFCRGHQLMPDVILCSPLRRAEQTARGAAGEMSDVAVRVVEFLSSGMQPDFAITKLGDFTKFNKLMIVGHEPDFSALTAKLLHAAADGIRLSKASLTAIQLDEGNLRRGTLLFSIPVKLMDA